MIAQLREQLAAEQIGAIFAEMEKLGYTRAQTLAHFAAKGTGGIMMEAVLTCSALTKAYGPNKALDNLRRIFCRSGASRAC